MTNINLEPGKRIFLPRFAESSLDAIDVLQVEDMPFPDVTTLKPTDVVVSVESASVAFVDMLMMSGQYQHMPPLPCTPGMEYAGIVAWVGDAVDPRRIKLGDRVMSDFMVVGPRSMGDYQANGGWASFAIAPQEGLHPIPDGFSFDQACNLIINYETAYYALVTRGNLQPGETVVILGASGAAGMAAIQIAKILGGNVIATGRSDAKNAVIKSYGADHVINTTAPDGEEGVLRFRDLVKDMTNGKGADMIYDSVGGAVSLEAMRSLAFGGRHVIVGWAGNTEVAQGGGRRGSEKAEALPTNIMQMKGLFVMGSPMVIASARDPSIRPPRLKKIFEWVSGGLISPYVSHTYPMSEFRDAMRAKATGAVAGGCVLHPDE